MFEIGNSLREARERQGLDLSQLEADTKIRAKYLRALEEERFDALPAESYARGFLNVYASRLGLDNQVYVDEFDSRFARGEGDGESTRRVRTDRRLRLEASAVVLGLAGIIVVTVLVIAAWQFSGGSGDEAELVATTPADATPAPPGPPASPEPAPAQAPPPTIPAAPPEPEPAAAVADASLEVTALEPRTRVTIRRNAARGKVIFAGSLARGETRLFEGRRLHAAFQSPASVEVTVNGETLTSVPRRLVATADGWRSG